MHNKNCSNRNRNLKIETVHCYLAPGLKITSEMKDVSGVIKNDTKLNGFVKLRFRIYGGSIGPDNWCLSAKRCGGSWNISRYEAK